MKRNVIFAAAMAAFLAGSDAAAAGAEATTEEANKALARAFYEDLWFSNNTGRYGQYVADTYVVHDIGGRKNADEPAIRQKEIADFFWKNGVMSGEINYQIAEDDLVATRWTWHYEPKTLLGHILLGRSNIPIINVFRFQDGKIVEIWNHRHDIDTAQTNKFVLQGFGLGLLVTLIPAIYAWRLRRRIKATGKGAGGQIE